MAPVRRLAAAFLLLVLNSAYLAARADATLFYFTNVALHVALGAALAVAAARTLPRAWTAMPGWLRAGLMVLAIGAVLGLALTITGATRPYRALLYAHIVFTTVGAIPVLAHLLGAAGRLAVDAAPARAAVALACLAAVGGAGFRVHERQVGPDRYRIV